MHYQYLELSMKIKVIICLVIVLNVSTVFPAPIFLGAPLVVSNQIKVKDGTTIINGDTIVDGTLRSNNRFSTGEYLQIDGVAGEGDSCSSDGLIGRDSNGLLLSCVSSTWRTSIKTQTRHTSSRGYKFVSGFVSCEPNEKVTGGGGRCTSPKGWVFMTGSFPSENGWMVVCDGGLKEEWVTANVWAVCAY